jgi:hypothetical protein
MKSADLKNEYVNRGTFPGRQEVVKTYVKYENEFSSRTVYWLNLGFDLTSII